MSFHLNQSDILAMFDDLVNKGEILYGPSRITRMVDQGFPVNIRPGFSSVMYRAYAK
jgi:hypothetical protein